ncbi:MAG: peptidoglycan DD-metalloendopeptidase family protein [Chloroflexales bacterium]|nr:peptidoglycan DD-metalloendopeptidase family protein [Chloroflexales bacterium]
MITAIAAALTPTPTQAATSLILPTPPGERWRIIQGYGCGTHNAWDRYSLDLAQVDGPTYNAPVRAAAGGEIWHWEGGSGTLILHHGDRFFTMYTHMARAVTTARGHYIEAGQTLGFVGDRGAPGVPHLHFTAFTASGNGWSGKQSVPLRFAEGYDLPDIGGCNQHGGTILSAAAVRAPEIHFRSEAQPEHWYNSDQRVEFTSEWSGGGLSQAWDGEPATEAPMFARAIDGYAQISDAGEGMHTLGVRVWGPDGKQSVATFGPVGFDKTPPSAPAPTAEMKVPPGAVVATWAPATDTLAGVDGYRVYIGTDPEGKADWFTAEPSIKTEPLAPGRYLVRVQTLDRAGNTSPWTTIGSIVVAP